MELDWLPEGGGEPHGYNEFFGSVDALVIGRKTFETVLAFDAWPYGDKRRDAHFPSGLVQSEYRIES